MSTPAQSIARLTRIAANLPIHIATAFNPDLYLESVQAGALAILQNCDFLTDDEKEVDAPIIAESIKIERGGVPDSLVFTIGGIAIYANRYDAVNVIMNPEVLPDKIREWVQMGKEGDPMGKRLDSRDRTATGEWEDTEKIAKRVFFAVKRRPQDFFGADEEGKKSLDPSGLPAFAGLSKITPPENLEKALFLVVGFLKQHLLDSLPESILWRMRTAIEAP